MLSQLARTRFLAVLGTSGSGKSTFAKLLAGHNVHFSPESGDKVVRATPRYNAEVNDFWMCDIGRFNLDWIEGEQRLRRPLVKRGETLAPTNWDEALAAVKAAAGSGEMSARRSAAMASASARLSAFWL